MRLAVANVFRRGQQREADTPKEGHVSGGITFLYLIDEPGEVYNARLNPTKEINVSFQEKWG
jgi:hypothetical protein